MNEKLINLLVLITLIVSFAMLLFVKPDEPLMSLRGWVNDVYFRNNNYVLKLKSCNYTEVVFDKNLLEEIMKEKNKYVRINCKIKDNKCYLVNIS
ncbi:MAG: hypothetical protein PWP03_156 [Candidatus Woesearchaeota archaeon]|nr:hypothetical protein [Candidatus Woesearchaeota archaeon]MDN5327518.1 hypothetical protein [Candidatus Woesearchaeota archaeon]